MRDALDDREKKNPTLIKRTTHGKKKEKGKETCSFTVWLVAVMEAGYSVAVRGP